MGQGAWTALPQIAAEALGLHIDHVDFRSGVSHLPDGGVAGGNLEGRGKVETMTFKKPRLMLRKIGEIALGDRWEGDLKVDGNQILIGKDKGPLSKVEPSPSRVIKIDEQPRP